MNRFEFNDPKMELTTAVAQIQGEMDNAPKSSDNPFFHSKYSDLATVNGVLKPHLIKHGIAIFQIPEVGDELITKHIFKNNKTFEIKVPPVSVTTMVVHKSGAFLKCTLAAYSSDDTPQSLGSIITYLRRYSLTSIFNISSEDDDGNSCSGRDNSPPPNNNRQPNNRNQPPNNYRAPNNPPRGAAQPQQQTNSAPSQPPKDKNLVYDSFGKMRYDRKTKKFDDDYQLENSLITSTMWTEIEDAIHAHLGSDVKAFTNWLDAVSGVKFYDIPLGCFDRILNTIHTNKNEILKHGLENRY